MLRIPRVRFSIRAIMVVAGVAGATIGLVLRGMTHPEFPAIPGMNMTDFGPDHNDPFPGRSFDEILRSIEESPTCRFPLPLDTSSDERAAISVHPPGPECSERMKHELPDPCKR
jgi:hypothetical protein